MINLMIRIGGGAVWAVVYLASADVMKFLFQNLLNGGLVLVRDEYKTPPLVRLWVLRKLDCLNLNILGRETSC